MFVFFFTGTALKIYTYDKIKRYCFVCVHKYNECKQIKRKCNNNNKQNVLFLHTIFEHYRLDIWMTYLENFIKRYHIFSQIMVYLTCRI